MRLGLYTPRSSATSAPSSDTKSVTLDWDWRWWRPLSSTSNAIYATMLQRLQADMLLLLLIIGIPLSLIFGIQLYYQRWADLRTTQAMFFIHVARVVFLVSFAWFFLRRNKVLWAWTGMILVTQGTLLLQIWLIREPGLLIFSLFTLAGPALIFSAIFTISATVLMVISVACIVYYMTPPTPEGWVAVTVLYVTLMLGFAVVGVVIRRFIRHFAVVMHEKEVAAVDQAKIAQQMIDLTAQLEQLTLLEHDLRQPLRAVQGYLTMLDACPDQVETLAKPAIAAAGRAERLVNNILDHVRATAREPAILMRPVALRPFLHSLEYTIPGLAQYYTDPPVPVKFALEELPILAVDAAQFERALLNLLDNAFAHSPVDGEIELRAWATLDSVMIEIADQGPGISPVIVASLLHNRPYHSSRGRRTGIGLLQVQSMIQAHSGILSFPQVERGCTVRLEFPLRMSNQ